MPAARAATATPRRLSRQLECIAPLGGDWKCSCGHEPAASLARRWRRSLALLQPKMLQKSVEGGALHCSPRRRQVGLCPLELAVCYVDTAVPPPGGARLSALGTRLTR